MQAATNLAATKIKKKTMTSKKEQREEIMTDEERVASCRKRWRRCPYCHDNFVETVTDRLFVCCNACAEADAKTTVVRKSLPCILCGAAIRSSMGADDEITEANAEYMSFDIGAATRISYGYGSRLDGNVYIIAICDNCTLTAVEMNRIIYVRNYIP